MFVDVRDFQNDDGFVNMEEVLESLDYSEIETIFSYVVEYLLENNGFIHISMAVELLKEMVGNSPTDQEILKSELLFHFGEKFLCK
jgi:hypothetical protein